MKEGWEYKTFEECIVKVPRQKQIKSKDYLSSGIYPVVSQEQDLISGYYNDESYVYKHAKPIVVFGDHTKNIKYIDFDFVIGADGTQILMTIEDIETKFFYYAIKSIKLDNLGYARHYKLLKKNIIGFPSKDQQRRIVSYLDSSFKIIDEIKNKALKSLTEAKALFQSALAEAMEPKEGWEEKTLGEICLIVGRIGFRGYTRKDIVTNKKDGAITLSPSNIVNGNMCYNNCTYISWYKYNESPEIKIQNGDILIVKTGSSYGKSAFVENLPHKATINPQFVVLKDIKINHKFLSYQLKTKKTYDYINSIVSGSAIPTFSQANLSKMLTGLPPLPTQKRIVSRLDKLSSKVRAIEEKYQKMVEECDALKQAMLRDVFE